jgi:hypothetical protein
MPDSAYVFQLRSAWADSLWSEPSNRAAGRTGPSPDGTPPAPVTPVCVRSTDHSVTFAWIAPGDDGDSGTAAEYVFTIEDVESGERWTRAGPRPEPSGARQEFEVLRLEAGRLYAFALMAADEVGNWSITPEPIRAAASLPEDSPWSREFAQPPYGHGLPYPVTALLAHDDVLYAGLSTSAWAAEGDLVYAWNGETWTGVGPGQLTGQVNVLLVWQNQLIAAGHIWFIDGTPSRNLVRWDGQRWRGFGSGPAGEVHDAIVFEEDLVIAGEFEFVDTTHVHEGARWDGERWQDRPMPWVSSPRKLALAAWQGSLYAANGDAIDRVDPEPGRPLVDLPWVTGCVIQGRNGIRWLRTWNGRLFSAGRHSTNNVFAENQVPPAERVV